MAKGAAGQCNPQPQFRGDAVIEPVQYRKVVTALRRGGQPEQLHRLQVVEECPIGGRRCVVELVDDDDVEMIRRKVVEVRGVETLYRSEDMLEMIRA